MALTGSIFLGVGLAASPAFANDPVLHWRMNSLLHPQLFGEAAERFARTVEEVSGGTFLIEVHDRLVMDQDVFGALKSGFVDAVWGSAGHHHREDAALTLFSGFPFGPDPEGFASWMRSGGGGEVLDAIYARHGMRSLFCGVLPAESGGWFAEPVETPSDLERLRMRTFGYAARVLQGLGVITYELPASDILPALQAGVIDAAEFSLPSIDAEIGIHRAAEHLYFPGWQQPATSLELLLPDRAWADLTDQQRAILNAACEATLSWTLSEVASRQVEALQGFRDSGVQLHEWPEPLLAALRDSWDQLIAAETARDPLLHEAWQSWLRFADSYGDWRVRAYPGD